MTVTPSSSPVMRRFLITVTRAKTLQDSWDSNNLQPHDRWCEEPGEDPMAGRIKLTPMGTGPVVRDYHVNDKDEERARELAQEYFGDRLVGVDWGY